MSATLNPTAFSLAVSLSTQPDSLWSSRDLRTEDAHRHRVHATMVHATMVHATILWKVEVEVHDEVSEWLAGLSDADWDRVVVVIDRLERLEHRARMPLSRSLGDGLFELRFSLGSTSRRITYRFSSDGRIVLLTTFRKQRDNERTEITRARRVAFECAKNDP